LEKPSLDLHTLYKEKPSLDLHDLYKEKPSLDLYTLYKVHQKSNETGAIIFFI